MGGWIKVNHRPDQLNNALLRGGGSHTLCLRGDPLVLGSILPFYTLLIRHKSTHTKTVSILCLYLWIQSGFTDNDRKIKVLQLEDGLLRAKMDTGVQVQPVKSIEPQIQLVKTCKHEDSTEDPIINLMWHPRQVWTLSIVYCLCLEHQSHVTVTQDSHQWDY